MAERRQAWELSTPSLGGNSRAKMILAWNSQMGHEVLRGALCLTPPPRFGELRAVGPLRSSKQRKQVQAELASWGLPLYPWPPPKGWQTTLVLRRLRIDNMVARRRLTEETQ